ncbi:MAG TPA: caspase family protein [Pyrinomonadaceae bacterium]|nr:caspase family protein [Pyrinomonadaceae bacterium]
MAFHIRPTQPPARRLVKLMASLAQILCLALSPTYSQSPKSEQDRQLTHPEATAAAAAARKPRKPVALVIGNSDYENAPRLANPANDAHDMAGVLKSLGFDVIHKDNQSADKTKKLIREFGERLREGAGVGLFYYAGHGVQVNGRNYLIPVEANVLRETTIGYDAVDVNQVLAEMESAGNELNIVVLDACRSNPFARSWRSSESGLAQINAPEGTLIAYATSPGKVASDGGGRNGLYTAQLLRYLPQPGLSLTGVFMQAGAAVKELSGRTQVPWVAMSITRDFYFNRSVVKADRVADPATGDREFWDSIKNSADPEDFRAYLKDYPKGLFSSVARNNLRRIEASVRTVDANVNESKGNTRVKEDAISEQTRAQVDALIKSGDANRMGGRYDSAIIDLTEAIRLNPNATMAYAVRGATYQAKRTLDLAALDLTQAIRIDPTFAWAYSTRAQVYVARGEPNLALSDLNHVIRIEPKNYSAYNARASVYRSLGRNDLAASDEQRQMDDLSEAIRLNPSSAPAHTARCDAYRMQIKLALALTDCTAALRLDPKYAPAYALRGDVYQMKGDYDRAISDLSEAIGIDPAYYWAYERRAEAYRHAGLTKMAEADAQKAKEIRAKQ